MRPFERALFRAALIFGGLPACASPASAPNAGPSALEPGADARSDATSPTANDADEAASDSEVAGRSDGNETANGSDAAGDGDTGDEADVDVGADSTAASTCDPGHTTTDWATDCSTPPSTTCVPGTWTDPGSTTGDPLVCESAHFAVHAPAGTVTATQCAAATDELENAIWPMRFGTPMFEPEPFCHSTQKSKISIVIHSD